MEMWLHGYERWGAERADEYAAMMRHVGTGLLEFPQLGPVHSGRHQGIRSIKAGELRIVYRTRPDAIEVVRILHARMDPRRHLG